MAEVERKFLESALDVIAEGVLILSVDGRFTYINAAAERILDTPRVDIIDRRFSDAPWRPLDLEGRQLTPKELDEWWSLAGKTPGDRSELLIERPDGTRVIVSTSARSLTDTAGRKIGTIYSICDITEKKRREDFGEKETLRRSQTFQAIGLIGNLITGTLSLKDALSQIVNYAELLIDAPAAVVFTLDKERRFFRPSSSHGISPLIGEQPISMTDALSLGVKKSLPVCFCGIRKLSRIPYFFLAAKEGFEGAVVSGIFVNGILDGLLIILDRKAIRLDGSTKKAIELFVAHAAVAVKNAEQFETQRYIADILQQAILLLPEELPGIEYGRLYTSATPEKAQVGGDFYDLFEVEHKKIGIVIGDVAGHGLEAAIMTALVKNTIKAYALEGDEPATLLAKTNEVILKSTRSTKFVSVFFGILDITTGRLLYCSAGHPPPIVKRHGSSPIFLETSSPIIGAFTGLIFEDRSIDLKPGDLLVLFTDGAVEVRTDGRVWDENYLFDFIGSAGEITAAELPDAIFHRLMEVSGGNLSDDIALLCVSWGKPSQ